MSAYFQADEVRELGIDVGDFVSFDPRVQIYREWIHKITSFR